MFYVNLFKDKKLPLLRLLICRINCSHDFKHVGVDYAGPVFYKNVNEQRTELLKCYILLITCAVTRVVHIEVTPDDGSYSLKLALIRFF